MVTQYRHGRFDWIGSFRWRTVAGAPLRLFTYAYSVVPVGPAISVLAIIVFATGSVLIVRKSSTGRLIVLLAAFPLVGAAGLWAGGMPIFDLRNLIGIGPYLAVLTVVVVDSLSHRLTLVVGGAIVGALSLSLATSNAERIPAYNVMARSLVQEGWSVSQPILVFGDPYRYRLPFEWYLPTNPVLHMSRVLAGACREIFVVSPTGKVKREELRPPRPVDRRLRGVTLLFDPAHRPRCVSLTLPSHGARPGHQASEWAGQGSNLRPWD
jgi:hypothetical protein